MSVLESSVEKDAVIYAAKTGWPMSIKISPNKSNGFPDRVFINRYGLHLYIEFKKPGERPRNLQLYRINQLRECRIVAIWTDELETAMRFLDAYVDTKRLPDESYPPLSIPGFRGFVSGPGTGEDEHMS